LTLARIGQPLKILLLDIVIEQHQRRCALDRLLVGDYLE